MIRIRSLRCAECVEKEERLLAIWYVNVDNYHRRSTREGMIIWKDMFFRSFVEREVLNKRTEKWYEQNSEAVIENGNFKLLWDFTIQCDRVIEARRTDIVLIDKRSKEVKEKELVTIDKYQMLR